MPQSIHILSAQGRFEVPCSEDAVAPAIVPATVLTIVVEGDGLPGVVVVDGKTYPLHRGPDGTRAHFTLDASRSVGFHRMYIAGVSYVFGTEDAKLRLEGIRALLQHVESEGLSWGHQLFFSDGLSIRDPRIDFAWLTKAAGSIIATAREVAEHPSTATQTIPAVRPAGAGKVLLAPTLSMLRQNPKRHLEAHASGFIVADGGRYLPRVAVAARRSATANTVANRRVTLLLEGCSQLAADLRARAAPQHRAMLSTLLDEFHRLLAGWPFDRLRDLSANLPRQPGPEERTDTRYRTLYEHYLDLTEKLGWAPGLALSDAYAYVSYSDEIYQAFVALVMAQALGAVRVQAALIPRLTRPVFESPEFELFYDTKPLPRDFVNWRDSSSRPAEMRPDLTLVDTGKRKGILLDAKYRVEKGRASATSLGDCQVYLNSFGCKHIAVCYPGTDLKVTEVAGEGNVVLEVPISPAPGLSAFLKDTVVPRLLELVEPLRT